MKSLLILLLIAGGAYAGYRVLQANGYLGGPSPQGASSGLGILDKLSGGAGSIQNLPGNPLNWIPVPPPPPP